MVEGVQGSRLVGGSPRLARLKAEVRTYREQIARGEVKPPTDQQEAGKDQGERELTIGDLGLPFISAHIA